MKTAQKVFSLFFCLLYVPSLLYVPGRINTQFQDKNTFSQSAKAQDNLYIPRFKRTLKVYGEPGFTPTVPWVGGAESQDRFNGFDKIGELPTGNQQKRVIAVGYGRLWEYQNTLTGNDWIVKAWYVPEGCVNEDVGANTRVEFYRDHVFIFRTGVSCEGESAFNFLHLQVYKYVGNVLTQVYHDSNLFRFNGGGAQYSPSTAIVGDVQNGSDTLYFGFFRPGDDGNAADKAVLGMIKGFNSDGTPKIHKLCQGYNPNTGAKCNITASIHHLIGSGNGHLYAFQQLKVGNMIRNTLVYLEVEGVGTGQGLSYKLTDFKPINNVYFEVGFGDGNLNRGYFTVFDSIFSFGKLIFAVGLREGNWPNCGSPETIRQIIVSFVPVDPINFQVNQFDVGSLVHGSSEVPTGRCNRGPGISENGYIFNGGGFVEINKDNTTKLLYGFTYCKVGPGSYGSNNGLIICKDDTTGNALIQYLNDTNWTRINMLGSDRDFPGRYSDVRVISMYYSESYKKLFAGIRNRDRVFNTAAPPNIVHHPGLWVDDFTQLIPPPTPTPTPPQLEGPITATCTQGYKLDPYRITFRVNASASNAPGARVKKIRLILIPESDTNTFSFDNNANPIPGNNDYVIADNEVSLLNNSYRIENPTFNSSGRFATFIFTVLFDRKKHDYYEKYLSYSSIKYAVFISDTTGRNNQESDPRKNGSIFFSSLDDCAALYYKTGRGDVGNFGLTSGKIRRINAGQYIDNQFDRDDKTRVSDYLYQGVITSNGHCHNLTRLAGAGVSVNDYCRGSGNINYSIDEIVRTMSLPPNIPDVEIIKINRDELHGLGYVYDGIFFIRTSNLAQNGKTYILKIEGMPSWANKVRVIDSSNSPNNIIVLCNVDSCNLEIAPVATVENILINDNNIIPYSNNSLDNFTLSKTRLYANLSPRGKTVLYSDPSDKNKVNIYFGGIITNNFFYTNNSRKTNIIRGFLYTKGIVATVNETASSNLDSNRNIAFRDFYDEVSGQPKPLLYVDYDPKYLFVYKDLFVRDAETVTKTVVGL